MTKDSSLPLEQLLHSEDPQLLEDDLRGQLQPVPLSKPEGTVQHFGSRRDLAGGS